MTFPTRLKELRKEKNCTQRQLAEVLGLTPNSICEWEKERSQPSAEMIVEIAKFFDTTTDYLLGVTDDFGSPTALSPALSDEERSFLDLFRRLSRGERAQILAFAAGLLGKARPDTNSKK